MTPSLHIDKVSLEVLMRWLAGLEEGEEFRAIINRTSGATLVRMRTGEACPECIPSRVLTDFRDSAVHDAVDMINFGLEVGTELALAPVVAEGVDMSLGPCIYRPNGTAYGPDDEEELMRFNRGEFEGHYMKFVVTRRAPA